MGLSLRKQLWFLCGGFLFVLTGIGVLSYVNSTRLMNQFDNVANVQMPAVRNMTLADMMHDGLRSVVLASLLASQNGDLAELKNIQQESIEKSSDFKKYLSTLESLPLNLKTKNAIEGAKSEMDEYIQITNKIVGLAIEKGYSEAYLQMPEFNKAFKKLEDEMESLGELIEQDAHAAHESGGLFRTINIIASVLGILFCLIAGIWITTSLVRRMSIFAGKVENTGESLGETGSHLSVASSSLANGATSSAASLEETVASLEELSSMVKLNSENAAEASKLSAESYAASQSGVESVQALIKSMESLRSSSAKIEEVIHVIDDIAFQTNLLALNASVEAARAGEQGKGFAVVADAVRGLAQRSAESAKDITKMIQESVSRIREGGAVANQSGELLHKILTSAEKVKEINNEIASASQEQARGIVLISEAMNRLDQNSQQNAKVAQEVAQSSEQMDGLSQGMQGLVTELKQLVGDR